MSEWKHAFDARDDLQQYTDNAIGLFAMAMRFGIEDLETVAADSITDGNDDKKCDIVYVNKDDQIAVIAQCYVSKKQKKEALANKASDLNTGVSWLIQRPIEELPERLKYAAQELREGIQNKEISDIYIWYIHNLPESKNVENEMVTVQGTAVSAINSHFPGIKIAIHAYEVGNNCLENWYKESQSPILVNESFDLECDSGYCISGPSWKAYATAINAQFLYRVYKKYKTDLFSANIRDYLGSRSSDSNINNAIKNTIENDSNNFWVFNNGLTILVHSFTPPENDKKKLTIKGLSIVNGAQTTGAVGSLNKLPNKTGKVNVRFVQASPEDQDIIRKIIQFNNSQNKVEASDFRSTDKTQKRLQEQMAKIPDCEYEGGRRGGAVDAIRRRPNLLPSYTVGQALACFHGDPIIAYNQKRNIWVSDRLYSKYFSEDTKATHIVCAYSLLRAVEEKKKVIVEKSKKSASSMSSIEEGQLDFFRKRGSTYLFAAAVASCLETFLDRKVPNLFRISFGLTSPSESKNSWLNILDVTAPFCNHLDPALKGGLKNTQNVQSAIQTFRSLVQATVAANKTIYDEFKSKITAP